MRALRSGALGPNGDAQARPDVAHGELMKNST